MRNRAAALSPALDRGLAHNTFDLDVRSIILTGSSAAIKGTLRRDQGRAPFLPADLDLGFQRSSHSVKCRQPGSDPTPVAFPQRAAPSSGQVVQDRLVTWLPGDLMRCSNCGSENLDSAKFCDGCAAPFPLQCPLCGVSNRNERKVLHRVRGSARRRPWGTRSSRAAQPVLPEKDIIDLGAPLEQHDVPEGKRKTVTALFADIKGSTERRNYLIALVIDWNCSNSCFRARSFISSGCVRRKRGS